MWLVPQFEARERKAQYRYHLFFFTAITAGECRMSRCRDVCKGQKWSQGWEGMLWALQGEAAWDRGVFSSPLCQIPCLADAINYRLYNQLYKQTGKMGSLYMVDKTPWILVISCKWAPNYMHRRKNGHRTDQWQSAVLKSKFIHVWLEVSEVVDNRKCPNLELLWEHNSLRCFLQSSSRNQSSGLYTASLQQQNHCKWSMTNSSE